MNPLDRELFRTHVAELERAGSPLIGVIERWNASGEVCRADRKWLNSIAARRHYRFGKRATVSEVWELQADARGPAIVAALFVKHVYEITQIKTRSSSRAAIKRCEREVCNRLFITAINWPHATFCSQGCREHIRRAFIKKAKQEA